MKQRLGGNHTIEYGTTQIEFEVVYTEREDVAIHVYPDCSVMVEAPDESDLDAIKSKVQKRAKWIFKQQRLFEDYETTEPNSMYVSGETYYYLGRRYRLKVIQDDFERVKFNRGRIFLYVKNPNSWHDKYNLMKDWYLARAKFIFRERLNKCYQRVQSLDIPFPEMQIRSMKSQWGSCTPAGKIILNIKLIKLPKKLIDYVILHELCHLKEHNHSKSFYQLLEQTLPNWSELRRELNQFDFT